VLHRWETPSILQALRMTSVVRMLVITCCLFCKYRILNKHVILIMADTSKHEGIIGCFLSSSELIQILFGYLIYKHLKGRRFLLQMTLLILTLAVEIARLLAYTFTDALENSRDYDNMTLTFSSEAVLLLTTLQGIPVYTLYYMMCICGPLDLAKVELLKSNQKVHSLLYGVLCGLQCMIQALFLDELIDRFLNLDFYANPKCFYLITVVDLACTVIAWAAVFRLGREEWRELRNFGFGGKMQAGSAVIDESASRNSKSIITDLSVQRHINRVGMGDGESSLDADESKTVISKK
jgi:hypothetical protein